MKTLDAEMRNAIKDYDGGMHRSIDPLWLGELGVNDEVLSTPEMAGMQIFDVNHGRVPSSENGVDSPLRGDRLSLVDYSSSLRRSVQSEHYR